MIKFLLLFILSFSLTVHAQKIPHKLIEPYVKSDISGIDQIDNTSDVNKPVSTAQGVAINEAIEAAFNYTDEEIANLVDSSPAALDTLNELALALGDDPNFAETVLEAIGYRLRFDINNQSLTTEQKTNAKTNLGIPFVENTADLDKPISTATQMALNLKANQSSFSNVDNTSDLSKPISTATQTALNLKANQSSISNLDNTSDLNKPISTATQTALDLKAKPNGDKYVRVFSDFIQPTDSNWIHSVSGGTASHQQTGNNATENTFGTVRWSVVAVNDRVSGYIGSAGGMSLMFLGNGGSFDLTYIIRGTFSTLPDATDTIKLYIGLCEASLFNSLSEPNYFVGFRYDPTVNSGKWQAVQRINSVEIDVYDTGFTPTSNIFDYYEVRTNRSGISTFFINGSQVAQTTTVMATVTLGMGIKSLKTAGSASRLFTADSYEYIYERSTSR